MKTKILTYSKVFVMSYLDTLRVHTASRLESVEVIRSLFDGKPDVQSYIRYLINVNKYAEHSPKVIAMAAARCMSSHRELASYLLRHAEEEKGHDLWALEDLIDLGIDPSYVQDQYPVKACSSMIGFMYYTACHQNPVGLFGWMYILEAIGNDLGALVADKLDGSLGLNGKSLRFVAGHAMSDQDHTKDLTNVIERYVTKPKDMADINHTARVISDLYIRMFEEISKPTEEWSIDFN